MKKCQNFLNIPAYQIFHWSASPPPLTQDREVHRVSYMGLRVDLALVMSGV